MSKFVVRANELLEQVKECIGTIEVIPGDSFWGPQHKVPVSTSDRFPELVLDIQMLLFSDSKDLPLFTEAMTLNDRRERIKNISDRADLHDFNTLESILTKYIAYREFLAEED